MVAEVCGRPTPKMIKKIWSRKTAINVKITTQIKRETLRERDCPTCSFKPGLNTIGVSWLCGLLMTSFISRSPGAEEVEDVEEALIGEWFETTDRE